jgi:hypothetical protein
MLIIDADSDIIARPAEYGEQSERPNGQQENAEFIVTACNEHETLRADNQRLNTALASIRATLETVSLDLDDAASTEALLVHALLLQRADHLKVKHDTDQCATCRATDKALSAAGVTE